MKLQSPARLEKTISRETKKHLSEIRSSHILFKEKESATYPFYYYYTEVWKDWIVKR